MPTDEELMMIGGRDAFDLPDEEYSRWCALHPIGDYDEDCPRIKPNTPGYQKRADMQYFDSRTEYYDGDLLRKMTLKSCFTGVETYLGYKAIKGASGNGIEIHLDRGEDYQLQITLDPTGHKRRDKVLYRLVERRLAVNLVRCKKGIWWKGTKQQIHLKDLLDQEIINKDEYSALFNSKQALSTTGHNLLWQLLYSQRLFDPLKKREKALRLMDDFMFSRRMWMYLAPMLEKVPGLTIVRRSGNRVHYILYYGEKFIVEGKHQSKQLEIIFLQLPKAVFRWLIANAFRSGSQVFIRSNISSSLKEWFRFDSDSALSLESSLSLTDSVKDLLGFKVSRLPGNLKGEILRKKTPPPPPRVPGTCSTCGGKKFTGRSPAVLHCFACSTYHKIDDEEYGLWERVISKLAAKWQGSPKWVFRAEGVPDNFNN